MVVICKETSSFIYLFIYLFIFFGGGTKIFGGLTGSAIGGKPHGGGGGV